MREREGVIPVLHIPFNYKNYDTPEISFIFMPMAKTKAILELSCQHQWTTNTGLYTFKSLCLAVCMYVRSGACACVRERFYVFLCVSDVGEERGGREG